MRISDLSKPQAKSVKESAKAPVDYQGRLAQKLSEETGKLLDKKTPSVADLAEKYKTSLGVVEQQLKKGIKTEMEHTSKYRVAKEIALDHLNEDLHYYTKLAKVELEECSGNSDCGCGCNDEMDESAAWQKKSGKNKNGGLNKKGVASYRREHPGSKLQTAVTTKPSKLKKGSKASKRRKSFCARMRGMKKHRTGAKTAHDPNSRINKSLRKWNCESIEDLRQLLILKESYLAFLEENILNESAYHKFVVSYKDSTGEYTALVPAMDEYEAKDRVRNADPDVRVTNAKLAVGNEHTDTIWTHSSGATGGGGVPMLVNRESKIKENFADGRHPEDKGDSRRHGIPKKASLSQLDKIGHGSGRKAQLARWQANMRRGREKH
jgi:Domain of unknown function (DUF6321)/Protein of unknown function (DUF5661)